MHHAVLRLRGLRVAVVLVEKTDLQDSLIERLQVHFGGPVMLIARDDSAWKGVKARAQFDCVPHLYTLLGMDDIEWVELRTAAVNEPIF